MPPALTARAGLTALILGLALTLSGCKTGEEPEPVGEAKVAADRVACEKRGGRFQRGGKGGLVCFTTPRDAGKQCRRATQCDSACLARSGTCAPVKPLFGCHEILTADGTRLTQCVD